MSADKLRQSRQAYVDLLDEIHLHSGRALTAAGKGKFGYPIALEALCSIFPEAVERLFEAMNNTSNLAPYDVRNILEGK